MDTESSSGTAAGICAEYRDSGLTQKAFCESRGIAKSTLGYWLRKERRVSECAVGLVRVRVPPVGEGSGRILIRVGNTVTIEIERPIRVEELRLIMETAASL